MSDQTSRPNKRAKSSNTPKPLNNPYSNYTIAELIAAILLPPEYEPLPYRDEYRPPTIELPIDINTDPYSLFTLFLTEAHFETIAINTNRYAEKKEGPKRRTWILTNAAEIKVFVAIFIYIGVVRLPAYKDY